MEKMEDSQENKYMNEDPQKLLPYFNPFEIGLQLLAEYGWWVLGVGVVLMWVYSKLSPVLDGWRVKREDAMHHKSWTLHSGLYLLAVMRSDKELLNGMDDPDIQLKRMEAMEAARQKQQEEMERAAKEYHIKEQERLEKKRQEYIERNEGKSGGNRLGARSDYMPLAGAGSSGGYKAPKKKCPGGGCGR